MNGKGSERKGDRGRVSTVLHEWHRSSYAVIRVSLTEYDGKRFLDIRRFEDYRHTGQHLPTKKGITLVIEDIAELEAGIKAAKKLLRGGGSPGTGPEKGG